MNKLSMLLPVVALALAAPAAMADSVKIGAKVPYADPASVRDAIKKECDMETNMSQYLQEFAKGTVEVASDLKDAKGKIFDAKIGGVWAAGGPWGAASILVEGELRENGKVVGTVASRRNTSRGGGACQKLMVSGRKVAEDIAEWLKAPTMDAKLGDAK
jgi:hypothetical protein